MIVYTCPKCGSDLMSMRLCSYPPVEVTACSKCGWRYGKRETITYVPFPVDEAATAINEEDLTIDALGL